MQRTCQFVFVVSLIALSWLGMQVVHELGHVFGALLTGASVTRIVLNPLTISRTDVFPNPSPRIVVWAGPLMGSLLPLMLLMPARVRGIGRSMAQFFAGFCLIANGAYISMGSFDQVGDAGVMLQTGTPLGWLLLFGGATIPWGLLIWHRMGSLRAFLRNPGCVSDRLAYGTAAALGVMLVIQFLLSPS